MKKYYFFVLLALLSGCGKNQWQGFVYLDKNDTSRFRETVVFDRLQSCRSAAWQILLAEDAVNKGFYECGMNCQTSYVTATTRHCEKLVR
ncbi:MAG: hypothetical protein PVG66_14055 [Chromatiales bacterium]|jgi:hypothetical protein